MDERNLQLHVRPTSNGNATVVSLSGPLTMRTVDTLKQTCRETPGDIVLHFEDVPAIDSSGIGALVNILITSNKNGRRFVLAELPQRPLQMLTVARVDGLFSIYSTLQQAEDSFIRAASAK